MLWSEVTSKCFLGVAALQLDQKGDWRQRGRAVSHFI